MKNFKYTVAVVSVLTAVMAANSFAAPAKKKKKAPHASTTSAPATTAAPAVSPAPAPQQATVIPAAKPAEAFHQGWSNVKASYTGIYEGGQNGHLDGQEGPGSNLDWRHIFSVGYKFHPKLTVSVAQEIAQNLFSDCPTAAGCDPKLLFEPATDPYITLSHASLFSQGEFSLPAYIRYYTPFSNGARSRGTQTDYAHGIIRFQAIPTLNVMDKLIELSMLTRATFRLAGDKGDYATRKAGSYFTAGVAYDGATPALLPNSIPRRDWKFMLAPQIAVNVTDKFQPYIYWTTNYIEHQKNGHFTSLNDSHGASGLGQGVEIGFNYNVTSKLTINPYVDFGGGLINTTHLSYDWEHASPQVLIAYTIL